ncbi:unnamed protein product [Allacma fusca]|uniref:E3 ubiquitin-protein ligase RBBP6 n=1 Tax=Allacma fusca TaxID=39272 RepID=A0A8J2KKP4_9HEXA|nr:unnamed protein product [Allacma fusca]
MNAQTEEVYEDDNTLIPKNTSVIVARLPGVNKRNAANGPGLSGPPFHQRQYYGRNHPPTLLQPTATSIDLVSMDATEEEKIKAMMKQSTDDYDPSRYLRIRGSGQHGRVPASYRCNKCKSEGHWIKDCPMLSEHTDIKKSTGIPRSSMVHVDSPDVPGAKMTPEGRFAVPAVDHAAYMEKDKPVAKPPPPKPKIPDELVCTLCDDLMTDALMVSCCATSYCDDCIRKVLLESDDQECPGCHEKDISPTSLIPNRFLRSQVNAFKNKTGYSKPQPSSDTAKRDPPVVMVDLTEKKADEPERRKLSLDELPDDLFPHSPRKIDPETETKEKEKEAAITEDEEKTDLYDFNDGSIPSPFASPQTLETQDNEQAIRTIGTVNNFYGNQQPHVSRHHQQSNLPSHHIPPQHHHGQAKEQYRPPRTPLHSGLPPLPSIHHKPLPPARRQQSGSNVGVNTTQDGHEPPPPGFGDILPLPPGEDRVPTPTGRVRDDSMHRRDRNERDLGNSDGPNRGSLLPLPGIPPFNPTQPPPGFNPAPSSTPAQQKGPHGLPPPSMYSGPPPGSGPPPTMNMAPPNQNFPPPAYHGSYRLPPPGNVGHPPMFHPGGGHHMRGPHPRERERDGRYGSRDRSIRKPAPREARLRDRDRPEEMRPVVPIDDPLLEFERLMREKDRRKKLQKQQQQPLMGKRSRSRSYSPARRTPPSPFVKRSRSRSFSRSPSPKRKRPAPVRRRKSYSRTPSRSPPPPRRHIRSRSRSRNRSLTPSAPTSKRRSPRRAPPFSPSPPPSRFPVSRKDKEDFYDRSSRYDGNQSAGVRYYPPGASASGSNSTKPYLPTPRDYSESSSKYEPSGANKYLESQKYDQIPPPISGGPNKYESRGSSIRERDAYHHHTGSTPASSSTSFRDRGRDIRDRDRELHRQVQYDFDPGIIPPGTESHIQQSNLAAVPSLFELDIAPPSNFIQKGPAQNATPQDSFYSYHQHHQNQSRHQQPAVSQNAKDRRSHVPSDKEGDLESLSVSLTPDSEIDAGSHNDRDSKKRHRKKSREGSSEKSDKKKDRKEKKRHKRKKEKEEKKLKKNKRTRPTDKQGKEVSDDEHTTTTADETGPSRRSSITETNAVNVSSKEFLGQCQHESGKFDSKSNVLSGEVEKITHELDTKNSNLTVIVCDSTVKSPERILHQSKGKESDLNIDKVEFALSCQTEKEQEDAYDSSVLIQSILNESVQELASAVGHNQDYLDTKEAICDVTAAEASMDESNECNLTASSFVESDDVRPEQNKMDEIPMVVSKWDQFGEEDETEDLLDLAGGDAIIAPKDYTTSVEGNAKGTAYKESADKKVTSEVLKRAENAIFAKAISAISIGSSRSSSDQKRSSPPLPVSSKRKVYLETVEIPEVEKRDKSNNKSVEGMDKSGQSTVGTDGEIDSKPGSMQTFSVKRSVRDRLGSKVTEEAPPQFRKDRSSPSRDRDKERQIKSQVGSAPARDRTRDRDRVRKGHSRSRSRTPLRLRKDRISRSKSKDKGRLDRERCRDRYKLGGFRSRSRSLKRSVSKSKRERTGVSRSSRSASRSNRRHINRKRTPLKLGRRSRSTSSHLGNRERLRDSNARSNAQEQTRLTRNRAFERESAHPKDIEEREPSPPGESGRSFTPPVLSKTKKTEEEEAWKKQANKFVPIGGAEFGDNQREVFLKNDVNSVKEIDNAWTLASSSGSNPVSLAMRKQKGRINIKLSSTTTSKNEHGKSSSSSSDEDDHTKQESIGKERSSGDSEDSRRDDKKRKRDRKKTKRRRSESSTSSSSDDSARRKSKKSKKKKKKSKKKKKVK